MFAAVRSGAGWLLVGTALGLAGCAAIPLPDIPIGMPSLPGFGPPKIAAEMEPKPLGPLETADLAATPATAAPANERPAFFVPWRASMPGMTRRPRIDSSSALPVYPESARRGQEEGVTTLESCVTADGRLVDVKLAESSGSVALDSAALAWARTAKFEPALFNGEPMAVCGYRLTHEWRVEERR